MTLYKDTCNFEKGCFQTPRKVENRGHMDPITGYRNIGLRLKTGGRKSAKLHRAVWSAKNGEIPKGMHIMHLDGNPDNCALCNLELGSVSENNLMKKTHGKNVFGNKAVPIIAVDEEKNEQKFSSMYEAGKILGVQSCTIGKILDTREKNKYYGKTYNKEGKMFTFKKL